jgi:hypothetical protein
LPTTSDTPLITIDADAASGELVIAGSLHLREGLAIAARAKGGFAEALRTGDAGAMACTSTSRQRAGGRNLTTVFSAGDETWRCRGNDRAAAGSAIIAGISLHFAGGFESIAGLNDLAYRRKRSGDGRMFCTFSSLHRAFGFESIAGLNCLRTLQRGGDGGEMFWTTARRTVFPCAGTTGGASFEYRRK